MERLMKWFVVIVFLAIFTISYIGHNDTPDKVDIVIKDGTSESDVAMILAATDILLSQCPDILKYWSDLKDTKGEVIPRYISENAGWDKSRGWGRIVDFQMTVVSAPSDIPGNWQAAFHTLYFRMGGGDLPGIELTKDQAARFCGLSTGGVIIDVPALGLIK